MAYSTLTYSSLDGATNQFDVTFPYISASHVIVTVDGSATTDFTWLTTSRIQLTSTPGSGATVIISRTTSRNARLVDYQTGSILTEDILDTDSLQAFYMSQEAIDITDDTIQKSTSTAQWDATSLRLTNVADPTGAQDAATKNYLESTWLSSSDKTNLTAVAAVSSEIALLGTSDAIADMNTLGTADVVADMNTLATADIVSDMNTLATADVVSDMNTLATADIVSDMDTLADISANITTVAGISSNVTTVAGISSDVTAVAADATDIGTVAGKATEIGRLGTADAVADMAILGTTDVVADMAILATTDVVADMNTLGTADVVADMNTLAVSDVVSDMNTLATSDIVADMNTLATSSNVTAMDTVATNITNVNTVSTNITNVNTTATNITDVNTFANRYRIESSDPSTSLDEGDLVYNTTDNQLKFYNGTIWSAISADTDVKTTVSSNDTTAGYLNGKLVAGTNVTFVENSDGGNESLTINATAGASVGLVLALGG